MLADLQVNRFDYWDIMGANQLLMAEMNAEVVVSAQQFYAKRLLEPDVTWSIRDQHMSQALLKLKAQLEMVQGQSPRIAVMAHNSHLGDGRATAHERQWNIGFLARETFGASVRIVGFSTYDGTVTALAPDGDRPTRQPLRPARADSAEALLHANYAARSGPKVIDLQRPLPADERVVTRCAGAGRSDSSARRTCRTTSCAATTSTRTCRSNTTYFCLWIGRRRWSRWILCRSGVVAKLHKSLLITRVRVAQEILACMRGRLVRRRRRGDVSCVLFLGLDVVIAAEQVLGVVQLLELAEARVIRAPRRVRQRVGRRIRHVVEEVLGPVVGQRAVATCVAFSSGPRRRRDPALAANR